MTAKSTARWAVVLAALGLLALAIPAFSAVQWQLNGYVQGRIDDTLGQLGAAAPFTATPWTFEVRRAYLYLHGVVDDKYGVVINATGFNATGNAALVEAYGEYIAKPYSGRLGLSRVPFGYEVPLASNKLITLERSAVSDALFGPAFTFQRGLFGYYYAGPGLNAAAAITNGNSIAATTATQDQKTGIARVGYTIPCGEIGVSGNFGKVATVVGGPTTTRQIIGADVEEAYGPFVGLAEGYTAQIAGVHEDGAYLTLAYKQLCSPWQTYARYDFFNPNTAADTHEYFKRATIGENYYFAPFTKLQLEYQWISDELNPDEHGFLGAQYQVSF